MESKYLHLSINQVQQYLDYGLISAKEVTEYLMAWNATPGRFTVAYLDGYRIRNVDRTDNAIKRYAQFIGE